MKKFFFIMAAICLLASSSQVSAQLIIRNNGHAEIGVNPNENDLDTISVLKVFGNGENGSKGRISIGDSAFVYISELGNDNSNRLKLYGKNGIYLTSKVNTGSDFTLGCYDPILATYFRFYIDLAASGYFVQSDERLKENIEPVEDVLKSLDGLEAVTYSLKNQQTNDIFEGNRYGFLAQNVKDVFPELVHTDKEGLMCVDYIGLIPILVQSIRELRAELAEVKGAKQEENELPALAAQTSGQEELEASMNGAKLYQNAPNPWSSETVIRYNLPQSVSSAMIYVYDMQGTQLKSIPASGRGESQVTLTARDLKAGMYIYALVADGQLIDSKKMILTN